MQSQKRNPFTIIANCSAFLRREIPDSHRNIFIVKTQSLFVGLSAILISNNFSGEKKDFCFHKKSNLCYIVKKILRWPQHSLHLRVCNGTPKLTLHARKCRVLETIKYFPAKNNKKSRLNYRI